MKYTKHEKDLMEQLELVDNLYNSKLIKKLKSHYKIISNESIKELVRYNDNKNQYFFSTFEKFYEKYRYVLHNTKFYNNPSSSYGFHLEIFDNGLPIEYKFKELDYHYLTGKPMIKIDGKNILLTENNPDIYMEKFEDLPMLYVQYNHILIVSIVYYKGINYICFKKDIDRDNVW